MTYDFMNMPERHGRDALAVDGVGKRPGFAPDAPDSGFDVIPMWVADMNFPTAPSVITALEERIRHPLFGYFSPTEEYFSSIIRWQETRHGVTGLTRDCIGYENGVLGGLVSALNTFCSRGDKVLLHSPTYIGFTSTLQNNGFQIVHSPLRQDDDGVWRMDYEDMEQKLREEEIRAVVFCSPHNPCGRVWSREELECAFALFVSDEIWSDILLSGSRHIPSQMISSDAAQRTVALYAPSKTFNLAGLIGSYHIIYNEKLRSRVRKEASLCHYNDMNVLSMHALIGAYRPEGAQWVDELCSVLTGNVRYGVEYIRAHFRGVSVFEPEGTYMLLLNCEQWCREHGRTLQELEKAAWRVGVAFQDGAMFNAPWSVRVNLALPLCKVREAMERLDRYVFNCKQ